MFVIVRSAVFGFSSNSVRSKGKEFLMILKTVKKKRVIQGGEMKLSPENVINNDYTTSQERISLR